MGWGKTDNAANSVNYAAAQLKKKANTANQTALYGNSTVAGVFGVSATESAATKVGHSGWVLRTVGTGGRAGRVQTEVLVAMGSITGDGENTAFPDFRITLATQPSKTVSVANNTATTLAVTVGYKPASTNAAAHPVTYAWQANTGSGFAALSDGAVYSNTATGTLSIANTNGLNNVSYRVVATSATAPTITSNAYTLKVS